MINAQSHAVQYNVLSKVLLQLHDGELPTSVHKEFNEHFKDASSVEVLFLLQQILSSDKRLTSEDARKFLHVYAEEFEFFIDEGSISDANQPGHPVQIFKEENKAILSILDEIRQLLKIIEDEQKVEDHIYKKVNEQMAKLGQFFNHFKRKENLFFPILEEYGYVTSNRLMWADDDIIRVRYKGLKVMIEKLQKIDFKYVREAYDFLENRFKEIIFQEEAILLPIVQSLFKQKDWLRIAKESSAFGFTMIATDEEWLKNQLLHSENAALNKSEEFYKTSENIAFGGGYLTLKEANMILNNIPLEITFVDKNDVFKYFNNIVESTEMMLVRTPISIGRDVENCHPPKTFDWIHEFMDDLKTGKRPSESMWFKKGNQYIHITYKGLFDENGEYFGILEYVQDIQPFLELPRKVKREISRLEK